MYAEASEESRCDSDAASSSNSSYVVHVVTLFWID